MEQLQTQHENVTPTYIQILQSQLAKMNNDNQKALFVIDKYTLNRVIKLMIRDEQIRITSREFQRSRNPNGKVKGVSMKNFLIQPIYDF